MKNSRLILIFIFSISFFSGFKVVAQDTIVKSKKEIHIAYDISKPVLSLINRDVIQQEVYIGYQANVQFTYAIDAGFSSAYFARNNYNVDISGGYAKFGFNKNVIQDANDIFSYGIRLASSKYKINYQDIYVPDSLSNGFTPIIPIQKNLAIWGEFIIMLNIQVKGNLSFGWAVRLKVPVYIPEDDYMKPFYVPGYGKNIGGISAGFNYYLFYKFSL